MFSTPQARAYLSQELTKNRLVSSQIDMMVECRSDLLTIKQTIASIFKILTQNQQPTQSSLNSLKQQIQKIKASLYDIESVIQDSNEIFGIEVNLRDEIKMLEQKFFKSIMLAYENKIKELKQYLFIIEEHVQHLQQSGFFPYVESIQKNNVLLVKSKYLKYWGKRVEGLRESEDMELKEVGCRVSQQIKKRLDNLKQHIESNRENKNNAQKRKVQKSKDHKLEEDYGCWVWGILQKRLSFEKIRGWRVRQSKAKVSSCLGELTQINKKLKEQIKFFKKIMNYQRNQALVRNLQIDLTREQCIDFLNEMNVDLHHRFQTRNIFLIVSLDRDLSRSKSLPPRNHPSSHHHQLHNSNVANDTKLGEGGFKNGREIFKDVKNRLSDSFLDQCSYLISERFIDDEKETEEVPV